MALNIAGDEKLYPPVTGDWYFLTDLDCSDRTGHSEIDAWEDQSTGLFVQAPRSDALCF